MNIQYSVICAVMETSFTDLQQDTLVKAGRDRIFTDVATGAKVHRPELDLIRERTRAG